MAKDPKLALSAALNRLFRPLIRLLLHYGIPFSVFSDMAKKVYVELALNEFDLSGRKPSVSRASILTGLTRKEVSRVHKLIVTDDTLAQESYNRAARVISGWIRDDNFMDTNGNARALPIEGNSPTFTELVRLYSGDVPVRAMLDELKRVGTVAQDEDRKIHLVEHAYIPAKGDLEQIEILGTDIAHLITTIAYNLDVAHEGTLFQKKVSFDNLPEEVLSEFRQFVSMRGQSLLEEFNSWLAEHDRDENSSIEGTGRMEAGVGLYYFEGTIEEDINHE